MDSLASTSTLATTITTALTSQPTTSTTSLKPTNDNLFSLITKLRNGSDLYQHQIADLIEPERYAVRNIHLVIWSFSILTYVLSISIAIRMIRSKAFLNVIDYFSFQIILCAFIAWLPSLILILYHWFELFTLRLCRLHYVILSTNETVPFFFILYMIIERFLYAYPSYKQKCTKFSHMNFIHLYTIFTWLLTMLVYALASPFTQQDSDPSVSKLLARYCQYNYFKLHIIATLRSVFYFILFIPALILIGFVLRYFYLMRGTNQVPSAQKLWTIRVTALLCVLVFYDIYLYYLEHIAETYRVFFLASLLRSTFFLVQIIIIGCTDLYWLEMFVERCACLCCMFTGQRRKPITPVAIPAETEFGMIPNASSLGHYSLVDDTVDDEFDRATNGPQPTLRVIA